MPLHNNVYSPAYTHHGVGSSESVLEEYNPEAEQSTADIINEKSGSGTIATSYVYPRNRASNSKSSKKWIAIGASVAAIVLLAAILGGVLGRKKHTQHDAGKPYQTILPDGQTSTVTPTPTSTSKSTPTSSILPLPRWDWTASSYATTLQQSESTNTSNVQGPMVDSKRVMYVVLAC